MILSKEKCTLNISNLEHLKIKIIKSEYVAAITDSDGHELLMGYGDTIAAAINDLHHNLI